MLAKREMAIQVDFDHLKNRVRCYAHIINICSSHIVASMTSTSKSYLFDLKIPADSNYTTHDDSDGELDDDDDDIDFDDDFALELADCYEEGEKWAAGIKRDPLRASGVHEELFISYNLWTNAGRAFVGLSKMGISMIGSA